MIQANQLIKFGRETKIMDIVDNLKVNDFYNVTGYKTSKLHGKMSRLKLSIVDVSKGKKDKANVGEFNFTANEFKQLYMSIRKGVEYITKNPISMHKANPYKVTNGFITVKTFKLTYEANMRSSSKWKLEITTGKANPNPDSDFGYNQKSYSDISKVFFLLTNDEIRELSYVNNFIDLWEKFHFGEFIMNRNLFKERAKAENYNEKNLNWNNNPSVACEASTQNKSNGFKKEVVNSNDSKAKIESNPKTKILCEKCNCEISKESFDKTKGIVGIGVCGKCLALEIVK